MPARSSVSRARDLSSGAKTAEGRGHHEDKSPDPCLLHDAVIITLTETLRIARILGDSPVCRH
jgi:hypothetical protein